MHDFHNVRSTRYRRGRLSPAFEVTATRMADRDGTNPDPEHATMQRYVGAQHLYFKACTPHDRATILIDNTTFATPRLIRG